MAIGKETREEIRDFLQSTAGSVVLDQIRGIRYANNDLLSVLNGASSAGHPDLVVARAGGVVDGVDRVLLSLDNLANVEGE